MRIFTVPIILVLLLLVITAKAQVQTDGSQGNSIYTAVPFLLITPDARAGSMGNAGVAVAGDVNSSSINVAKLANLKEQYGFGLSYTPWLKSLAPDINLGYLSGYYKLDDRNTIAASLRYFSLGNVQLLDENRQDLGSFKPNEIAVDASFVRSFGDEFALGSTLRFIYSNLGSSQVSGGKEYAAAKAVAVDVAGIYRSPMNLFNTDATLSIGANISNIGTKVSYSTGASHFLPGNLKLGAATTFNFDDNSDFTFALDFNKLLVPTQPNYDTDGNITSGKDPDRSVPSGIFGSFSDAPGGFTEELKEVGLSTGIEYTYNKQFALRAGYQYQSPTKGNARYFTVGAGFKYDVLNLDLSYLIADAQTSPLANTLRFSLLFNFGSASKISESK
ncbi:hypothetical protein ABIB40_003569 [Pedobacter sp. UYP30]|uniref:type IX secretion system outer membrane channel protein PorV n=1 Tax=Pedobacter sp. UYP30 TaxID=1756400 RepID=UPI0033986847